MHSDGPYVNQSASQAGLMQACTRNMDRDDYKKAVQHERVYTFWSVIQSVDNLHRSLNSLQFIGHDKPLQDLMDDLVKQWMKERRNALENM